MEKLRYLNVGCGSKFHKDWYNVDMTSNSSVVIKANLLIGIPFPDNFFEIVYHSQVLEHIPKEKAGGFIKECLRVLKPNGILRIVVPDLENIVDEYKRLLIENMNNPNEMTDANYDWIMLEMYDQTVRNHSGGQMAEFLKRADIINEKYIFERIGYVARDIRNSFRGGNTKNVNLKKAFSNSSMFIKAIKYLLHKIYQKVKIQTRVSRIGAFRLGGEIHMWMYDKYSLSRLLRESGFSEISIKNPFKSDIPNWSEYELDIKDGAIYDPTSLFIEARKTK
jgi:predicted SAM-dependent methyltransferase